MKKILGVGFIACALTACGGGSDGDSHNGVDGGGKDPVVNAETLGVYTGTTNQGQDVVGLVDKNKKFWFLYTPPYRSGVTGFITGNFTVSGNTVKATNGKDFYFGGSTVYDATLNGTVDAKKSLNGTISYSSSNQVSFNTVYDAQANNTNADLSTIAGTYSGTSAIVQGIEGAGLTISNTGVVSGTGQSGCNYSGTAVAVPDAPYYSINLVFSGSPCYLARQEVKGVAYYDLANKTLYAVAETSSRQNAVLYLGVKR